MPLSSYNSDINHTTSHQELEGREKGALPLGGQELAGQHALSDASRHRSTKRAFMARLCQHESLLERAHERFQQASQQEAVLSYAAEWFLDNYYLLQRIDKQIQEDFSERYYDELPKLGVGSLAGYPRVFDIARALVISVNCQLDVDRIRRYLDAYQTIQPLRIGELWALPIMLRIVLLEAILQHAAAPSASGPARLGALDEQAAPPLAFLVDLPLPNEEVIATAIPSLRLLLNQDWKDFFESVSRVESILHTDPAQIYGLMDFETRDRYRKAVEMLAAGSVLEEATVAEAAVALAEAHLARLDLQQANSAARDVFSLPREAHVGYYLVDRGQSKLEKKIGYKADLRAQGRNLLQARPTALYLGGIGLGVTLLLGAATYYLLRIEPSFLLMAFALFLLLVPAVSVVTSVVNWLVTQLVEPQALPKLDFIEGAPDFARTFIVIPSMLGDKAEVASLLRQLEGHYLRNPDPNLLFALLTDFTDASEEQADTDAELLEAARSGIQALNSAYPHAPFYLFNRRRVWNEREGVWMGWERKRGKLHEFNRLLRGAVDTTFSTQFGALEHIGRVRYVITLDADTVLPQGSATTLIGALAHPLNQARFDPETGNVVSGYTILQPRTEILPPWERQSLFSRVFAGDTGLDLYSRAVSDVYQDLFGEGIYVGKGIYDIDAFERSLEGRIPENSLLSHDLFEGVHGRAGLITDVILFEDYPPHYLSQVRRTHRWVRGDWQLLPWLLPVVPVADGRRRNRLALIDLWRIADNLRRSLLSPVLLLLLVAGWTVLPGPPLLWTLIALLTPAVSLFTGALSSLMRLAEGERAGVLRPLRDSLVRWLLYIAFLPYEATLNLDAILTTLVRLLVTRRHLLQWTTASHTARLFGDDVSSDLAWQNMISSIVVAAIIGASLFILNPDITSQAIVVALPLLALWALSPELAYLISRPEQQPDKSVAEEQMVRLRRLARRTWFFFERFVGPDDNWLPPDNYQEDPKNIVAHRTSPTNIGLYLLSAVTAQDLGYIDVTTLMLRLRSSFTSMQHLERYRGHFLNWYTTNTLEPLPPRYVSTVDSGNLAGCLVALRQALHELPQQQALRWARWEGFLDTVGVLVESVSEVDDSGATEMFLSHFEQLHQRITKEREAPSNWSDLLEEVQQSWFPQLEQHLLAAVDVVQEVISPETFQEWRIYVERATDHLHNMRREYEMLAPWVTALRKPPELFTSENVAPALQEKWLALRTTFEKAPTLADAASQVSAGRKVLNALRLLLDEPTPYPSGGGQDAVAEAIKWIERLDENLESALWLAQSIVAGCADMRRQSESYVEEMDFRFLFNRQRQVFHIGYNLDAGRLDDNYYDLLASEARISSLMAIAKNDVPSSHWLHLSRPVTSVEGRRTLLSWSGTMFEYLMPPLLLPRYTATLLDSSSHNAIQHQIKYATERGVPWGISESGFYSFDAAMNYQYRAFGVPGLGFKRGLGDDLVITPYASLLALPFCPDEVLTNLDALDAMGMKGRYGYFEALDFTESRLPLGKRQAIVSSYMAHHQGMILLSLANFLNDGAMVRRFHADSRIQSVELLLQEQVPLGAPLETPQQDEVVSVAPERTRVPTHAWTAPSVTAVPAVHFLSNGRYRVMFTNSGGGYSSWRDTALTRWRPDTTLDDWGQWLYIQECDSDALWSATLQPTMAPGSEEISFFPHKVQWRRRDRDIVTHADVFLAPDDDVEIRRFRITNDSDRQRRLRFTDYAEVVLGDDAADRRHQAFSKLFIESEFVAPYNALLFRRRPRAHDDEYVLLAHSLFVASDGSENGDVPAQPLQYETNRLHFVGRNSDLRRPQALQNGNWLTGTTGATLDPIMALGKEISLAPYSTVEMAFITVVADSRRQIEDLLEQYQSSSMIHRTEELARSRAEHELQRIDLGTPALERGQRLLSLLLYPHPARRAPASELAENRKGQSGLWAYGISGDYPILLVSLQDESESEVLQEVLRIHGYWYNRGLKIDVVILNDQETNYGQTLQNFIFRSLRRTNSSDRLQRRGGIFILSRDQIDETDLHLLKAAARVWLDGAAGSLEKQMAGVYEMPTRLPTLEPTRETAAGESKRLLRPDNLLFDNGYGGFSADGKEYVVYLAPGENTPAPWINVIANSEFGFIISESGGGFSWFENSGENRLTTWRNDPVLDQPSEALYLRDEETVEVWSPLPQPAPANSPYLIRHGAGYTTFEHSSYGIDQETRIFAAPDAPVKIVRLQLRNTSGRQRRVTATYYAEWVLGSARETTQQYLIPEYVAECNAVLVRNPYNSEFGERVAFLASIQEPHGVTADRSEFLGRLGSIDRPAALRRIGLESAIRAGGDTCGGLQLHVDLGPDATENVYFILGQGMDRAHALQLIDRFQKEDSLSTAWEEVHRHWDSVLGAVQVQTPDKAMNLLLNRWLLYQALSCRIWGRSALYQSSGAYGFRDQLQDVMAIIHARPALARKHILRAARHQFEDGDVLHWWHPPSGRGVRTRISDDLLWLPHVTAHYVNATGDMAILDEKVPFLQGKALGPKEEERYGHYQATEESFTLFEHCLRALYKGMTRGRHGLPLIGGGDWNDGMNRVGIEGEGESIWLGWFLIDTLHRFAVLCEEIGSEEYAASFRDGAAQYKQALETAGWDGEWYRRAYYDDGTPLGSRQSDECQIDAIAQSWSVLSGAGAPERQAEAMEAVERRLIDREARLLRLFTPPFDKTPKDPGYIKGYLPGVRENGGQYTHAALWTIWAYARMGKGGKAEALFRLINPVHHAATREGAQRYMVEPYVVAADVYGVAPHTGRGGWTWYTGSSGWMYRLGVEGILGLQREGNALRIEPAIPESWSGFTLTYRFRGSLYVIEVVNESEALNTTITLDGVELEGGRVPLQDDEQEHHVRVRLAGSIPELSKGA